MNVFTATGNLGKDARVNNTGGTAVANFSIAVKSGYGDKAQTIWVDCSLWGKQAESGLIDYLVKGQMVSVSGELGTREYDGKTYITMRVNSVTLCGSRDDSQPRQSEAATQPARQPQNGPGAMSDDIPFAPVSSKIY